MQTYLVGGAVRDALLGRPVQDRDWVVVGSTPAQMEAAGFVAVGRDFPVFLHPHTKEEYALARTERKTAPGYRGFVVHAEPEVTLEEDLARRDLTMNSIAVPADCVRADGTFDAIDAIDPFRGAEDLKHGVLRHTTQAFAEDPVRILRVARFAARFDGFTVDPATAALMQQMVSSGEADHLVPERVWQELATGLMEQAPSRMFEVLRDCGALARLLPEVDRLWGVPQVAEHHPEVDTGVHVMMVLDTAARFGASLPVRFSALTHDLGKGTTPADLLPRHHGHEERSVQLLQAVCRRLRVPVECAELAQLVAGEHGNIHRALTLNAKATLRLLERCDALRRPQRFAEALLACECDARGRLGLQDQPYPQRARLAGALKRAQAVVTSGIAAEGQEAGFSGQKIGELIASARIHAIAEGLDA